jgi:hypothetical protein
MLVVAAAAAEHPLQVLVLPAVRLPGQPQKHKMALLQLTGMVAVVAVHQ